MDEIMFFANFDYIYPPHGIHGWKATDLSVVLAPRDRNLMHPTSRQNFGDGPGQTPKLILTLCRKTKISEEDVLFLEQNTTMDRPKIMVNEQI